MPLSVTIPFSQMLDVNHDLVVKFDGVKVLYEDEDGWVRGDGNILDMRRSLKNACYTYAAGWNPKPSRGSFIPLPWKQTAVAKRAWHFFRPVRERALAELPSNQLAMLRRVYGMFGSVPQHVIVQWNAAMRYPIFEEALTHRAALYVMSEVMRMTMYDTGPTYDYPGLDGPDWRTFFCFNGRMNASVWQSIDSIPGRIDTSWCHNMATWHLPRAIHTRAEWSFMAAASDYLVRHWDCGIGEGQAAWRVLRDSSPDDFKRSLSRMKHSGSMCNTRSSGHLYNFFSWVMQSMTDDATSIEQAADYRVARYAEEVMAMLKREEEYLERRRQRVERRLAEEANERRQDRLVHAEQLNDESTRGLFGDIVDDRWAARNLGVVF